MENSLDNMIVSPVQACGPWVLLIAAVLFLYWLTFTSDGRNMVQGIVEVAYVSVVITGIWMAVIATLARCFLRVFPLHLFLFLNGLQLGRPKY